jgi:hypothetical protein
LINEGRLQPSNLDLGLFKLLFEVVRSVPSFLGSADLVAFGDVEVDAAGQ